ncbi:hypothetical protein [Lachnobacterium bovis]|uniref:Uncharacterized protein n=1 Tax=Lachnobacterium bovis TaxID=140626 RepID=A0A1H9PD81_9FIRM|nr:hypothetical protein [Lachnobacterium bovis]SER46118.1 hypothetical protein SAMN02910429_00203 [Lachnobacterium bovis]
MRVLIGGMIFMIKNVQFLDNMVCLYPLETPFLFEVPYDEDHNQEYICDCLLNRGYLAIDWLDEVKKEYF